MEPLGLIISWLPVLLGETVVLPLLQTGEVNLVDPTELLTSHVVVPSVPFRRTSAGVRKICAALRTASVTTSFETIIRRACKVSPLPATSSTIVWSIGGMTTGMMSGMSPLINNLRGEFLLVVSVSVTFLFFSFCH